jgi:glucose-6-phosphate 1-dehydrogenase
MNRSNTPAIIIIFGATGDLSTRKLIPALFDLFQKDFLPARFRIIGVSRRMLSHADYRQFAKEAIEKKGTIVVSREKLEEFLANISYTDGTFDQIVGYERLGSVIASEEATLGQCASKLFYLAVPPIYYKTIFESLAHSGLTMSCNQELGWTRVLVEKPFGNDIETARNLDVALGTLFKEEQIFRIDHYLAKEVLQDILMFRFSNALFEPLWNNNYIERVEISMLGRGDLSKRGSFYDNVGALRDTGQNHMLQMLAFVAMENPLGLDVDRVRSERAKIFKTLRAVTSATVKDCVIRAQYEGYADIPSVAKGTQTETYFRMKTFVDNERWRGVPFYLESGQALEEEKTEIKIYFKKTLSCFCIAEEEQKQNILTFRIQPDEGISILFWAKKPGLTSEIEPKELSFSYRQSSDAAQLADAYEKVLFDGIAGDQMLFASTEEVSASWEFITPILELFKDIPLHSYKRGSRGPKGI